MTKRAIHAFLSPDARAGWFNYAEDRGVSVTGLLEALGIALYEIGDEDWLPDWTEAARKVDKERRRRG